MANMNQELLDVGRGTDKPKGFVKIAMMGLGSAIVGLCTYIAVLVNEKSEVVTKCSEDMKEVMKTSQQTIDDIRVEYYNKLEQRMNRLENVEQRVDSLPQTKRK